MGRNPTTESPPSSPEVEGKSEFPETPEKHEAYPRMFPRIGPQYQTRIGKETEPLDRPKPQKISTEYPENTLEEVSYGLDETKLLQAIQSETSAGSVERQGYELDSSVQRGGRLLYKPMKGQERFLAYCQPLFTSLPDKPPPATTQVWKQHMIHLHGKAKPSKPSRGARGTSGNGASNGINKRKREEEELVWDVERFSKQYPSRRRREVTYGEDEACALEFLHLEHRGAVATAELKLAVDMTAGKACDTRKMMEMKLKKEKLPHVSSSDSWRLIFERSILGSVIGKVDDIPESSYPVVVPVKRSRKDSMDIDMGADDDLKGAWRSVLACGKSIEEQLRSDTETEKKPLLSTVISFLSNAYGLPVPEKVFGPSHVITDEVSHCLGALLEIASSAREARANLFDMLHDDNGEGVDMDAVQKFLEVTDKSLPLKLDEVHEIIRIRDEILEWESRVNSVVETKILEDSTEQQTAVFKRNDLKVVEQLEEEGRLHGVVSKSLVQLRSRLSSAHSIRNKILKWKTSNEKASVKTISNLVRDASRLDFTFPELEFLYQFHRDLENWTDRANIAIRSRISLTEIRDLIQRGESMPLDLSDYLDKLKVRVQSAEDWLVDFEEEVPCPKVENGSPDMLAWTKSIRETLADGNRSELHELASIGNRIPVEVDAVKLLQVEIDAKNWSAKARKWVPAGPDTKRGKVEELREHGLKAESLRERLTPLTESDRDAWVLEGEEEIISIVERADQWFEDNQKFIEFDNRRANDDRACLSIEKLRDITRDGSSIHANIGNALNKMSRILSQAEEWHDKHRDLLSRCGLLRPEQQSPRSIVSVSEMMDAVTAAKNDVSLDLDEALELKTLVKRIEVWFEKALNLAPKRSKRASKVKPKYSVNELLAVIDEADKLPVNTQEDLQRLQIQLSRVQEWRSQAGFALNQISSEFDKLRESITLAYGDPKEFSRENDKDDDSAEGNTKGIQESIAADAKMTDPILDSDEGLGEGGASVHRLIKELLEGSRDIGLMTAEGDAAEVLDLVSRWCTTSIKYLESPRDIFDKRYFGAFDRFLKEGEDLIEKSKFVDTDIPEGNAKLGQSYGAVVADQLERLEVLKADRAKFISWCEVAAEVLADKKKLTSEKVQHLAEGSRDFPSMTDMVQKVRGLSVKVNKWRASTRKLLESEEKMSLPDANYVCAEGEKLDVNSPELKELKAVIRSARNWSNRVRECNLDQGSTHVDIVKELIEEHDSLKIDMPDELATLEDATQNYCVCRRPYEGFMIGCDECEEWYHGQCIGVSESRADRVDKFVCVRCSIKNTFKASAKTCIGIIRKWTSLKDLKKARQVEAQKQQRRVRKENKDSQKLQNEISALCAELSSAHELLGKPKNGAPTPTPTPLPAAAAAAAAAAGGGGGRPTDGKSGDEKKIEHDIEEHDPVQNVGLAQSVYTEKDIELKKEGIKRELEKRKSALQHCIARLETLNAQTQERLATERKEDGYSISLRKWVVRIRSRVMVPRTDEQMLKARPLPNGELSTEMISVLVDAKTLGVDQFEDFKVVENSFKSMAWCLHTLSIICRKPTLSELERILSMADSLPLPGEKTVRSLKAMMQKVSPWRARAVRALCPKPGGESVSVESLREVLDDAKDIPVHVPEAWRLQLAIKDSASRHCTCRGLNDGRFMICCDKCELWFHGSCVDANKDVFAEDQKWLCASCSGKPSLSNPVVHEQSLEIIYRQDDVPEKELRGRDDFSEHSPNPEKLWPPVGLIDTTEALEAIGSDCFMIPDDTQPLPPSKNNGATVNALPGQVAPTGIVGSLLEMQSNEGVSALNVLPSTVIPASSLVTPGTLLSSILAGAAVTAPTVAGLVNSSVSAQNATVMPVEENNHSAPCSEEAPSCSSGDIEDQDPKASGSPTIEKSSAMNKVKDSDDKVKDPAASAMDDGKEEDRGAGATRTMKENSITNEQTGAMEVESPQKSHSSVSETAMDLDKVEESQLSSADEMVTESENVPTDEAMLDSAEERASSISMEVPEDSPSPGNDPSQVSMSEDQSTRDVEMIVEM